MMNEQAIGWLAQAFEQLLGSNPHKGDMAFTRALPSDVLKRLAASSHFQVAGWEIFAVRQSPDPANRTLTSEQAVERREDKHTPATLLLIDSARTGAGLDGIYSAAREIDEATLTEQASVLAREAVLGHKGFVDYAVKRARRVAHRRRLSPWVEFGYLCAAVPSPEAAGAALDQLGLWPIAFEDRAETDALRASALLTERLLGTSRSQQSPEAKVTSLQLPEAQQAQAQILVDLLRRHQGAPAFQLLDAVRQHPELWVNRLRPGLIDGEELKSIRLESWRARNGKPLKWSGLTERDDHLELHIPREQDKKSGGRLEVRWRIEPEALPKGAVEYLIQIIAGDETLAEKTQPHGLSSLQKTQFAPADFGEFDRDARFDAQLVLRSLGAESKSREATSEDFVICVGEIPTGTQAEASAGRTFSTLALAIAEITQDRSELASFLEQPGDPAHFALDKQGFISCRSHQRRARVATPPLLLQLAEDWLAQQGAIGRWRLTVRADGEKAGAPEFLPIDEATQDFIDASRGFADYLGKTGANGTFLGPLGVLYHNQEVLKHYVASAREAWQTAAGSALTLTQTLEIVSHTGDSLGLIVLPTHPLRVAWQQGLDQLILHHRYEEKLSARAIEDLLPRLTGSYCPAFLPASKSGDTFVFADNLGLHATAMVPERDPEPQATVALLAWLLGSGESVALSVGRGTTDTLAFEIRRYLTLHPEYRRVQLHALRAGDAKPVARALGQVVKLLQDEDTDDDAGAESASVADDDWPVNQSGFDLWLYPASNRRNETLGRFIADTAARKRTGTGVIPERDRWMFESLSRPNGISLPRLRWYRHHNPLPEEAAHLALAFDLFRCRVQCLPSASLDAESPLEVHGLVTTPRREFLIEPGKQPQWRAWIAPQPQGPAHPANPQLTEQFLQLQQALMQAVARHLGHSNSDWPVLITEIDPEQSRLINRLHDLCDWVMTIDRNAGIEYFDSPKTLSEVYQAFIIDCIPERDDLGFMQLITSTSKIEELSRLLTETLTAIGLSRSERNSKALLDALKAISGRIVLRLGGDGSVTQELIALALLQLRCAQAKDGDYVFPSLTQGIFIPLDDLPDFFSETRKQGHTRADLLYVCATDHQTLRLDFIEVKFRRHLKTARAGDLMRQITHQLNATHQSWQARFGPNTSALAQRLNAVWLARILRFYADKGRRHQLAETAYHDLIAAINHILLKNTHDLPSVTTLRRVGFVFCPEYGGLKPASIGHDRDIPVWLFGPEHLPETIDLFQLTPITATQPKSEQSVADNQSVSMPITKPDDSPSIENGENLESGSGQDETEGNELSVDAPDFQPARILLGYQKTEKSPVYWETAIHGNPHMMIVGNSGMGKTTCLINLCQQLHAQAITPIVFSYHQDIDETLLASLETPPLEVRFSGLGFNPMEIVTESSTAFLDTAGKLRDIFKAIFPDLGNLQLSQLRKAFCQSYEDRGWSRNGERGDTPAFSAFLDLLRSADKPDRRLLNRLDELADYGLFDPIDESHASLLDTDRPSLIQIHSTQNEHLQRAFSSFVLYNLYQSMFRRGPQQRITHAIIFDEAHRAARLKLIPTMVKECRKYGIAFIVASQEAGDFDQSLFTTIATYLTLRVSDADAQMLAKQIGDSARQRFYADQLKKLARYQALLFGEGIEKPQHLSLLEKWPY